MISQFIVCPILTIIISIYIYPIGHFHLQMNDHLLASSTSPQLIRADTLLMHSTRMPSQFSSNHLFHPIIFIFPWVITKTQK